jgi:16S rRNA (cytidine1402-2'-O)-methyltransferase
LHFLLLLARRLRLQAALYSHHVKAASGWVIAKTHEEKARRQHNAPLLRCAHARGSAAMRRTASLAHLNEHQGAIRFAHDEVNLPATAPWCFVVALYQRKARALQLPQHSRLSGVAHELGAGLPLLLQMAADLRAGALRFFEIHLRYPCVIVTNPQLLQAAASVAGSQHYPQSTLYMVATPIGNLADISLRALHVLGLVDAVACEDTRVSGALLRAYGIDKPLVAIHQHNEAQAAQAVVTQLQAGQRMAYVSDAGTPAVSDPGARLAAAVRAAGLRVLPLPGASSITTLLSAAGATDAPGSHSDGAFVFAGFLPSKAKEREAAVASLAHEPRAVLLLEAPHRIESLGAALAALGQRSITLGRELTKQFEEIATLPALEVGAWLAAKPERTRGEFALLLHPTEALQKGGASLSGEQILQALLPELPLKTAVKLAASLSAEPRNELYERALQIKAS